MNWKFWTWPGEIRRLKQYAKQLEEAYQRDVQIGPGRPQRANRIEAAKVVTEAELAGRFAAAPDNPLFEAVLTVLAEKINATAAGAADETLTDRAILWRMAGADALLEFREDLLERERQARQQREETTNGHE